jgi:hypothetical protein
VKRPLLAVAWLFATSATGLAQVQPGEETTQFVVTVSEAFLDQLVKEDFAAEYAFLSDELARMLSPADWQRLRQNTKDISGRTQRYSIHGLTYYQDNRLLAAVDFSGRGGFRDVWICGSMMWELPEPNAIGLVRFEQNVVSVDNMRSMQIQEAVQVMTTWRCPASLIEDVLGVTVN